MEATPVAPGEDERGAIELLRSVFPRDPSLLRYEDEYPLAFAPRNRAFRRVVRAGGRVVSHAAALPARQKAGAIEMPVGFIGSVATAPDHRGRGAAAAAVRACEEALADEAGAVLAMLWSSEAAFYEKQGYFPAGTEIRVTLPADLDPEARLDAEPLAERDLEAVREIHAREESLTHREAEDERRLFAIYGTRAFVSRRGGRAVAYAVVGRGADFPDHVHEWGGSDEDAARLIGGVAGLHRGRSLTVLVPAFREAVASRLARLGGAREVHPLGLAKCLRPGTLAALVNRMWRETGISFRAESSEECGVEVVRGDGGRLRLSTAAFVRAVVGPAGRPLPGLPVPFFVWGMDSI